MDYTTLTYPCGLKIEISGDYRRLEASTSTYSKDYPYRVELLKVICGVARFPANIIPNEDGTTKVTLVNGGQPDIILKAHLQMIDKILCRALFKNTKDQVEKAAKSEANSDYGHLLKKVISWTIFEFLDDGLCLFIYKEQSDSYNPKDRIPEREYQRMMENFRKKLTSVYSS